MDDQICSDSLKPYWMGRDPATMYVGNSNNPFEVHMAWIMAHPFDISLTIHA